MLEQLTSTQLTELLAYDEIDPVGEWRDDYRMAVILSHITNLFIQVYGKKETKLTTPKDFLLIWSKQQQKMIEKQRIEKTQSVEEMKAILLGLASANQRAKERQGKNK